MVSSVSEVLALVLGSAAITENNLICLPLKEGWKWARAGWAIQVLAGEAAG